MLGEIVGGLVRSPERSILGNTSAGKMSTVMIHQVALFGGIKHLPRACVLFCDVVPHAESPEIIKQGLVELVVSDR